MKPLLILTHDDVSDLKDVVDKLKEGGYEPTILNTATATFTDILSALAGSGEEEDEEKDEEKDEKKDDEEKDEKKDKVDGEKKADDTEPVDDAEFDLPPEEEVPEGATVFGEPVLLRITEGFALEFHSPRVTRDQTGVACNTQFMINESIFRTWEESGSLPQLFISMKNGKTLNARAKIIESTDSSCFLRIGRETIKLF